MPDPDLTTVAGQKRKQPPDFAKTSNTGRNSKRAKQVDARTILTQASDKALNRNGDLDVSSFVKAREFEIKAMETSMGASKRSLSSRAFQQVPNELRRRTASHNVKKVPRKLRSRAGREVSIPLLDNSKSILRMPLLTLFGKLQDEGGQHTYHDITTPESQCSHAPSSSDCG